ncbi:MAG: SRPBCC domain-containing protein [Chitinophaga sp.]|uniref:SRPBCC family protein n=1 Tax=Chitinophaga sp. TaxID=1869181 RepID=UPI001B074B24|nr:SRPBCC domain-containing protein [Chitinophaga sp.]MBO9732704.1 SRPBCC domain-containing protein [Chitinophaga sp.]
MANTIKHQFFFPHPAQMVWDYLTKPELMEQWLMKNDFQPVVGLDFQFRTGPIPSLDFDGIFYCKVLEIVPLKRLTYSWKCGPGEGKIAIDSVVRWRLEPKDKGTELFLEHSGFSETENLSMFAALKDGWLKNLHKIADRINTLQHGHTNA